MILRETHLTTRCNSRCRFCLNTTNPLPKQDMDFSIIEKIPFDKIKGICFVGHRGEPTLYPRFMEVIHLLKEKNIVFRLYSNMSTHNPDWWVELGRISQYHERNKVQGCIDGIGKIHENYRVGIKFDKVIENFKSFNNAGGKSICNTILFDKNENQIKDIRNLVYNIGCVDHRLKISWDYDEEYNRPKSMNIHTRKEISKINKDKPINCEHLTQKDNENQRIENLMGFILRIDGRYIPCCHINQMIERNEKNEITELFYKCKDDLFTIEGLQSSKFYRYIIDNMEELDICNKNCRNISCRQMYIGYKRKFDHKNDVINVYNDEGKSFNISLKDIVLVDKRYPDFDFTRYRNIWGDLYPDIIKSIVKWDDKTPFSYSQYLSKKIIIDELKKYDFKNVMIIGSWVGLLARMIHDDFQCFVTTIDKDPKMKEVTNFLNRNYDEIHLHVSTDIKNIDVRINDVVINTSCEHMNDEWFHRIKQDQLIILQSTEKKSPDHVNTVNSLEEMKEKYPMIVFFEKEISPWTDDNKRFMLIGKK